MNNKCNYFNECEHCLYYDTCSGKVKEETLEYYGYEPTCEMFDCRFFETCRDKCI